MPPICGVNFCNDRVMIDRRVFSVPCWNAAQRNHVHWSSVSFSTCLPQKVLVSIVCTARPVCPVDTSFCSSFFQLAALLCFPAVIVNWSLRCSERKSVFCHGSRHCHHMRILKENKGSSMLGKVRTVAHKSPLTLVS